LGLKAKWPEILPRNGNIRNLNLIIIRKNVWISIHPCQVHTYTHLHKLSNTWPLGSHVSWIIFSLQLYQNIHGIFSYMFKCKLSDQHISLIFMKDKMLFALYPHQTEWRISMSCILLTPHWENGNSPEWCQLSVMHLE
jgi:hypothetical protein